MITTRLYFLFFIFLSLPSFFSYVYYNPLPTNILFELLVFTAFLVVKKRMTNTVLLVFLLSFSFLFFEFLFEVALRGVNIGDFFIAYKSFFYLMILSPFAGKHLFSAHSLNALFRLLLIVFLIKYVLWWLFADIKRPGVFAENNFELLFLLLVTIAVKIRCGKLNSYQLVSLTIIMFLSGSRSGLLSFLFVLFIFSIEKFDFKLILKFVGLSVVALGVFGVFVSRMGVGGIESVDRFVFFQNFLFAISDWDFGNFIFGSYSLSPLPDLVCSNLSFYESLFSLSGDGTCYSIILHSFLLRVIYDHGLLGLFFLSVCLMYLMLKSGLTLKGALTVLGILAINGLSVSSFNSVYSMIGMILLLSSFSDKLEFSSEQRNVGFKNSVNR